MAHVQLRIKIFKSQLFVYICRKNDSCESLFTFFVYNLELDMGHVPEEGRKKGYEEDEPIQAENDHQHLGVVSDVITKASGTCP